jgi:hypothetical protein
MKILLIQLLDLKELERQTLQRQYNIAEMSNEFRILSDDIEKVKDSLNYLIESGITNNRGMFDYFLKQIKYLLKDAKNTKRWFLYWRKKNWIDKEEEE